MGDVKEVDFYNPHQGLRGRDGGPYLDEEERLAAERRRAKVEDREPEEDLDVVPATAGTPLAVKAQLVDNLYSNPSMDRSTLNTASEPQLIEDNEYFEAPDTLTVSTGGEPPSEEEIAEANQAAIDSQVEAGTTSAEAMSSAIGGGSSEE